MRGEGTIWEVGDEVRGLGWRCVGDFGWAWEVRWR